MEREGCPSAPKHNQCEDERHHLQGGSRGRGGGGGRRGVQPYQNTCLPTPHTCLIPLGTPLKRSHPSLHPFPPQLPPMLSHVPSLCVPPSLPPSKLSHPPLDSLLAPSLPSSSLFPLPLTMMTDQPVATHQSQIYEHHNSVGTTEEAHQSTRMRFESVLYPPEHPVQPLACFLFPALPAALVE